MLPKINRLTKKKDFDSVFKKGKSLKGDFLICKILKNSLRETRIGFIVSKKISNKATMRNKIKRRMRAAAISVLKNNLKPADIVIIGLPGVKKQEFQQIKSAIAGFLKSY